LNTSRTSATAPIRYGVVNGSWRFQRQLVGWLRTSGYHNSHVHPRGWISSAATSTPDAMADAQSQEGVLRFGEPSIATTRHRRSNMFVPKSACWCCSRRTLARHCADH
jgi:hypothetical protein